MTVSTRAFADDDNGRLVIQRTQDVEPILESAKRMAIEGQHGSNDMRHAARLPMVLVETYCNTNGITFEEFMRDTKHVQRMINDPALASFRIWRGREGRM